MLKVNTISNKLGTVSVPVEDLVSYPLSSAWDGLVLTTETSPTLASLNIIGTNPEAKLYPDGSIVGSSDNGEFTMWANGKLECTGASTYTTATTTADFVVVFPISMPETYHTSQTMRGAPEGADRGKTSAYIYGVSSTGMTCRQIAENTADVSSFDSMSMTWMTIGRWK